jgi:hypothetical protein
MICTIHQPNYLPYLGFFEKAHQSDIFILYDTTQFKKNDWQNRNKICTPTGWQWISLPVLHDFGQKINEVKIKDPERSLDKNWRTIQTNYGKAPYFKKYADVYKEIYSLKTEKLNELNCNIIIKTAEILGIKTNFIRSSELPQINSTSTAALIELSKSVGADTYISGAEGKNYIDMDLWNNSGLIIKFQNFIHPVYRQYNNPEFQSHMCVLDLIFNYGDEGLDIITNNIIK